MKHLTNIKLILQILAAHPNGITGVALVREMQQWRSVNRQTVLSQLTKLVHNKEALRLKSERCCECDRPVARYKLGGVIVDAFETATY